MATLRDIGSGPMPYSGGHSNSDGGEDEENEGNDEGESWFAGGERRYTID